MAKHELKKVLNTTRKSDYNGEQDYGSCGDRTCNTELQARVDCEQMIADLDDVQNLLELSGSQLAKAYATSKPSFTVAQLYKKMDTAVEVYQEQLAMVSYSRDWYNRPSNEWQ